jgi:short-subunit dehydrogenase involved in D-alanine esterification of teichoic acids
MDGTGKLSNKIALITGGTTGIGAATATCFQAEGARVIVTGSNPATLQVARENMPGIEVIASDAGDVAAAKPQEPRSSTPYLASTSVARTS